METYPKYWRKAIKGSVGGRTLNKKGDPTEFLLKGDPSNPDADLDAMAVEIYDEDGENFFKRSNKAAIKNGYLIEISDYTLTLDEINAVSDGYLKDLLKKPLSKMRNRVLEFTSVVPVARLLEFAETENKPLKTIEFLRAVVERLEGKSNIVGAEMGDVKVQTTSA